MWVKDRKKLFRVYRYFSFPKGADTDKAETTYKNVILELRIPKKKGCKERAKKDRGQISASADMLSPTLFQEFAIEKKFIGAIHREKEGSAKLNMEFEKRV